MPLIIHIPNIPSIILITYLTIVISNDQSPWTLAAPASASAQAASPSENISSVMHLHNSSSEIMIEDDKAFWDARPSHFSNSTLENEEANNNASQIDIAFDRDSLPSRIPGKCKISPLEFDCGNGLCIPIKKWRDCHADCPGAIDEECWSHQVRCDVCKCVDPSEVKTLCRKY